MFSLAWNLLLVDDVTLVVHLVVERRGVDSPTSACDVGADRRAVLWRVGALDLVGRGNTNTVEGLVALERPRVGHDVPVVFLWGHPLDVRRPVVGARCPRAAVGQGVVVDDRPRPVGRVGHSHLDVVSIAIGCKCIPLPAI